WVAIVLPAILLNYAGQTAIVLSNGGGNDNPFFKLAAGWILYPAVALATLATVIASQAIITLIFADAASHAGRLAARNADSSDLAPGIRPDLCAVCELVDDGGHASNYRYLR